MRKFYVSFFLLAVLSTGFAYAQGFKLDDPNVVFKDKDGKTMTSDSVKSFVAKGQFGMMKKDLGNGKTEVTLIRQTQSDLDAQSKSKNEWYNQWINKPFPGFSLQTLSGKSVKKSDLDGKVAVLNFWFIGCQPCVAEMPKLNQLVNGYEGQPVVFLAFTFDKKESVEKFMLKHDFLYTQLPNSNEIIKEMTLTTFPTHLILDKNGIIREIEVGGLKDIDVTLKRLVDKTLKN